jgi:hypothetical protein
MTQPPTPPSSGFPGPTEPFTPVSPEPFYTPPAPPARKSGGARGLNLALAGALLIAGCGVSFALGRATAPAAAASVGGPGQGQTGQGLPGGQNPPAGDPNGGTGTGNGPIPSGGPNPSFDLNGNGNGEGGEGRGPGDGGFGRGGFGSPSIQGTVQATDGKSITLKLANGQTITISLDANTTYSQQTAGSASDVAVGKTVIVSINGRLDFDGQEGGSTASKVTVVP